MSELSKLVTLVIGGVLTGLGLAGIAGSIGWFVTHVGDMRVAVPATVAFVILVVGLIAIIYGGFQPLQPLPGGAPAQLTGPPVALVGRLDAPLSRWLWLVKWLLVIPHLVVLSFLFIAFIVLTVVAFLAILFTERYPLSLFETNLGIMRWAWRVGFYAYDALGTDRYPPFTLQDVDYPARFHVAYPDRLSRGLVLVKWWLLALPHYLVLGIFSAGVVWTNSSTSNHEHATGGLLQLLVFFAAVCLLVAGRYPEGIFNFVVGLNRWIYRVGAYVALMRDEYPPFRLDLGPTEGS
jgi:hypothetical protein